MALKRPNVFPPKGTTNNKNADHRWTLLFSEKVIKPHQNFGISGNNFAFYWARLLLEISVAVICEPRTWSSCAGGSLTLLLVFELCKDRRKLLLFFCMWSLPLVHIFPNNLNENSSKWKSHIFHCWFICLNKGFPTVVNVWAQSQLTGTHVINSFIHMETIKHYLCHKTNELSPWEFMAKLFFICTWVDWVSCRKRF